MFRKSGNRFSDKDMRKIKNRAAARTIRTGKTVGKAAKSAAKSAKKSNAPDLFANLGEPRSAARPRLA